MEPADVDVRPAHAVPWEDVRTVLDSRADGRRCSCQRWKMQPGESWASVGAEALAARLREQVGCDDPDATTTAGLVAYLDGEPVGWCAVEPRSVYGRLLRNARVPWDGRDEDRSDAGVWAVTCVLTRARYGGRGIATALAAAAVVHARRSGARAVEAYPMTTTAALPVEMHLGTVAMFAAAGLRPVVPPTARRVVMRLEL